jgi:MscS family membrane protein
MLDQYIENNYLRALVVLVISFIILRFVTWVIEKVVLKLTVKTKTDLDDLILEKTSKPFTYLILLIGIWISIKELVLNEAIGILMNKIIFSLIFVVAFYIVYTIINLVIWRTIKKYSKGKNEALYNLTEGFLKVILIIAAFLSLLSYWGIAIGPLLAGLGIGGIAIAFALQSSLANVFGGISIILDKTIRVGDLVKLEGDVSGKILNIGLRSTKVKTFDNEIIIVPNSKLADENIHNVAQPNPKSRVVIPFGVAYGSDVEKVKKIVLMEIKKVKGYVNEPEAYVKFLEMGDSSLNFKAYFFVESFENRLSAIDEANTRIYNALNKAKIEIPFPQMDVRVKK